MEKGESERTQRGKNKELKERENTGILRGERGGEIKERGREKGDKEKAFNTVSYGIQNLIFFLWSMLQNSTASKLQF